MGSVDFVGTLKRTEVAPPEPAITQNVKPVYELASYVFLVDDPPASSRSKPMPAPHTVNPLPLVCAACRLPLRPPFGMTVGKKFEPAAGVCVAVVVASLNTNQKPIR